MESHGKAICFRKIKRQKDKKFRHCNAGKFVIKWLFWYYRRNKCLNFGHGKLGKVMEKVTESHGILESSKSTNPVKLTGSWPYCELVIYTTQGNNVQASDLETHAKTHNFPWRKIKITKCELCTVETSINNSFIGERVFYHLNEWFLLNRTADIMVYNFFDKVFRTLIINISQVTCRCVPKHRSFEVKKITKWEQPTIETLINNHLVKKRAIYLKNEWFVSIITRDIFFRQALWMLQK